MRGPIIGVAFFLGAAFVLAMGTLPACAITPTETVDAGMDVYIPPQGCDTIGYTCAQCQTCPAVQTTCGTAIAACEDDPNGTCLNMAMCNDACDVNDPEDTTCKEECCNEFGGDPDGVNTYLQVANCIYTIGCPQTCYLQRMLDVCTGF
jgi:hypothetical protein